MKKFTLFLVALFAMVNVTNAQRAWAYDLELTPSVDSYTFAFKAVTAGDATLVFYKEGEEAGTLNLGPVPAGAKTVTKTSEELLSAIGKAGDFTWGVKMSAGAINAIAEVTNQTLGIYDFYNMMGVVVDNDPESENFSMIYIQQSLNGSSDGSSTRADKQKAGVFIYDQGLNELNNPSNVGIKPTLPTGYTMGDNRNKFHRLNIHPITGDLVYSYNISGSPAVFAINRDNMTSAVTNLLDGITGFTQTCAHCFDAEGTLYVMDLASSKGTIYKIKDGIKTKLTTTTNKFVNASMTMVSDGRGGLWVTQNRGQIDNTTPYYYQLVHVTKDGTFDWVVDYNTPHGFTGSSTRGALAYDVERQILAQGRNGKVELYNVTYDATTGLPTVTPFKTVSSTYLGTNIDGLAFDYAGDLYVVNSSKEKFQKFAVPTTNNTCTVPAKKSQVITLVSATPEYNVTINVVGEGTVTGANTGTYLEGTELTLTATPAAHYEFTGWTGTETSTENPLIITVDDDKNITANFAKKQYTLTVSVNDGTKGSVNPTSGTYAAESEVQITAEANPGFEFTSWSNGSKANPLTITMEGNTELTANFRAVLASSITLNAHPVRDYSASIVGTMKRAIQNGENTIVLTHEANGTAHIYNIAHATKTITEISQEGVVAVDPDNAGDFLAISDIAMTEDGKLVACNYMMCQITDNEVDAGYKRGISRFYIWDNLASTPRVWFTSQLTGNYYRASMGYTMALKGTSLNAEVTIPAFNKTNDNTRYSHLYVVDGTYTDASYKYSRDNAALHPTTLGKNTYELNASPLAAGKWIVDGEKASPIEFVEKNAVAIDTYTALNTNVLGKKYNGASYLFHNDHHLMIAPYAADDKLAGVKVLGITDGFGSAVEVTTSTNLVSTVNAVAAAATAYVDGDGDLTIYLFADSKVFTFSEKVYTAQTFTVTATAGEGGSVEGGGTYEENTTAKLTATPAEHYDFVNWTEGEEVVSTTAEYSFIVTKTRELTANFQEHAKRTITASAADNTMGYVTGGGTYYVGETVTLKATAKTGYYFTGWSDSNTDNPRTITVEEDATLQANFAVAHPRVYAYALDVVDNGDSYTFSFKPNTDAVSGNLLLYGEDGTTIVQTHAISTAIVAHTATSITLNKTELPNQADIPWAIQLSGNAIPAFAETFADSDLRFARAHAVIDNSPESEYFGRVYVADRRNTKSNSKVYVYNPDFTDFTTTQLGLSTAGYSRPAVGADGTLYLTGYTDGAEAGIFVVDPADLTKCTQFFNGTYDSDGLYKNNGKEIGSSTSGVGVYGAGKDAVLYTMMEDGSNANFNSGIQPIVKYQIGQENGTVLKQWSDEPTWLVNYPATGKDTYNFGNNDFAATAKGVWVSQNKSNPDDRPEIAFVDKTGTIQFMQNSKPCLGGGMTVNADNTVLYIVEDGKILEYAITWNENKPSLTLSNTYPISLQYISTLSVDYAGNLIACAGTTYKTTDNNVMKLVAFTLPTNDNTCTVPAAKAKALELGERYSVTVEANPIEGGTVTGAGEYPAGKKVTVTATAKEHYEFANWTIEGEVVSTDANFEYTVPAENVTLTANFKLVTYSLITSTNDENKGTVSVDGVCTHGSTVTLTATAKPGYKLLYWSDRSTENPRTITMTKNEAISAYFVKEYAEEPTFKIEKMWENTKVPASTGNGFQAVGWDGKIYMQNKAAGKIQVFSNETDAPVDYATSGIGQKIAVDEAGNMIVCNSTFAAATNNKVLIYPKGSTEGKEVSFTLLQDGRCDFFSASGNIYSAEGGYVYFYCQSTTVVNRVKIANGELVSVDVVGNNITAGNSQNHVMVDIFGNLVAHSRSAVINATINVHTNESMPFALIDHKYGTLGGCSFELGGKELWAYHAGATNYSSEWNIYNMTDSKFLSDDDFYAVDKDNSTNNAANWLNVQVVDENTAYIYQFCPKKAVAMWKVSINRTDLQEFTVTATANNPAMGTVTGGDTYYEEATATLIATPNAGYRFVNWTKASEEVSTDATYTFTVTEDVELVANFAPLPEIAYELNGGQWNKYGWTSKGDMFAAFMTESGATGFETLDYYKAQPDPLGSPNICAKLNNPEVAFANTEKWGWLKDYIKTTQNAQIGAGASELDDTGAGQAWRYAVGAFFAETQRTNWPKSADFTEAGKEVNFQPTWGQSLPNPTQPTTTFVLGSPYKEGYLFDGWYAASDFSGAEVTIVDETTNGILYAKWKETIITVTIGEDVDNTTNLAPHVGKKVTATVTRYFGVNKILTVTLPFDMSAAQISTHFGNATVYKFYNVVDAGEELHLQFSRTTSIEAGKPYIIQTAASGYEAENGFTIENVTINTDLTHVEKGGITMVPVLDGGGTLNQPTQYYLSNNALYCAGDYEQLLLPGLRAFFTSATSTPIRARVIFDDNEATSIPTVIAPKTKAQKIIKDGRLIIIRGEHQYNAQGQMIE